MFFFQEGFTYRNFLMRRPGGIHFHRVVLAIDYHFC